MTEHSDITERLRSHSHRLGILYAAGVMPRELDAQRLKLASKDTATAADEIDRLRSLTEGDPTCVYHEVAEQRREIDRLRVQLNEARSDTKREARKRRARVRWQRLVNAQWARWHIEADAERDAEIDRLRAALTDVVACALIEQPATDVMIDAIDRARSLVAPTPELPETTE